MSYVIRKSSLLVSHTLKVKDWGVVCNETVLVGGKKKWKFGDIDFVLMSEDHVLSIQVGTDIFTIATRPDKPKHRTTIEKLLAGVGSAYAPALGFQIVPNASN